MIAPPIHSKHFDMAGFIAKFVGKKLLQENAQNRFGTDDPYFEQVPATRLDGRPGKKMKKVKKRLPPGISDHDAKVLNKVKRRAYRLDLSLFNFCGVRFGWSAVIGLVPFLGDVVDAFLARMVISTAKKVEGGLPKHVVSQMYMNVVIDFVIGFIPVLGDIADAVYKANTRNAVLLENELRKRGKARLKGRHEPIYDPSLPDEYDRESEEDASRRHNGPPPRYDDEPVRPARAHTNGRNADRGYYGGNRERDLERGEMEGARPQTLRKKSQRSQRRY